MNFGYWKDGFQFLQIVVWSSYRCMTCSCHKNVYIDLLVLIDFVDMLISIDFDSIVDFQLQHIHNWKSIHI